MVYQYREFHKLLGKVQKICSKCGRLKTVKGVSISLSLCHTYTHTYSCPTEHDCVIILKTIRSQSANPVHYSPLSKTFLVYFPAERLFRGLFPVSLLTPFRFLMCYLFFFLSFLLLLTEMWGAFEERAEAWPLVFRWSNNLFLVGNSVLHVTQQRLTSFWRWK